MGLTGEAIVTIIQVPREVRSGNGRVVTATFKHSSGDCINSALSSDGTAETIGTTGNHPFWSVDRQDYVQAGAQQLDERVQTYSRDTKRIISKLARPGPEAVYNLEVHGEHVYYVGVNGVLVHNTQGYANIDDASVSVSLSKSQLPVLNLRFTPNSGKILQRLTDNAVAELAANPALARDLNEYRQLSSSNSTDETCRCQLRKTSRTTCCKIC